MKYLPLLQKTLGREIVLPKRRIGTIEEFIREYPDLKEFFLDGSERPVQRPKKNKVQKKNYSGKKKTHTVKNGIIATKEKRILFLSKTHEGKKHDSPIAQDMEVEKLQDFF
jgi:nucleoside phosphorylase